MNIDLNQSAEPLSSLRAVLAVDGGRLAPPDVIGALLSYGTPKPDDVLTYCDAGDHGSVWRVIALLPAGLLYVNGRNSSPYWSLRESENRTGEIRAMLTPFSQISSVLFNEVRTSRYRVGDGWGLDIDGTWTIVSAQADEDLVLGPIPHSADSHGDFCRRLLTRLG